MLIEWSWSEKVVRERKCERAGGSLQHTEQVLWPTTDGVRWTMRSYYVDVFIIWSSCCFKSLCKTESSTFYFGLIKNWYTHYFRSQAGLGVWESCQRANIVGAAWGATIMTSQLAHHPCGLEKIRAIIVSSDIDVLTSEVTTRKQMTLQHIVLKDVTLTCSLKSV